MFIENKQNFIFHIFMDIIKRKEYTKSYKTLKGSFLERIKFLKKWDQYIFSSRGEVMVAKLKDGTLIITDEEHLNIENEIILQKR